MVIYYSNSVHGAYIMQWCVLNTMEWTNLESMNFSLHRHQMTALPDRKRIYMPQAYEGGRLIYRSVHIVSPFSTLQQLCLKFLHKHLAVSSGQCPDSFYQNLDRLEKDTVLLPVHRDQLMFLENNRIEKNLPIYVNVTTGADWIYNACTRWLMSSRPTSAFGKHYLVLGRN